MGLISKEVEVNLNSMNIKYYEDLGYEIPRYKDKWGKLVVKRGTKIVVKVKDLQKGSNIKVKVKCDCCGKEYEMIYQIYLKYVHEGNISYCQQCHSKTFMSGENNPNYKPNKTQEEREQDRSYPKYTRFVKKVLARDNYTCQCCGNKLNHDGVVHHLDGYNWCVEKRTDETNGITLCKACHKNFHSIYGKGNNTKEQFEEWFGNAIELAKYEGELPTTKKIYCIEENKIYDNALELAKEWNVNFANVYSVCNHKKHKNGSYFKSLKDKHLLWLDEYEKCSEEDLKRYLEWCKPNNNKNKTIYCITTGEKFNSIKEANEYYNASNISACCKGKYKSSGKLPDGTPLQWKYYEDPTLKESEQAS